MVSDWERFSFRKIESTLFFRTCTDASPLLHCPGARSGPFPLRRFTTKPSERSLPGQSTWLRRTSSSKCYCYSFPLFLPMSLIVEIFVVYVNDPTMWLLLQGEREVEKPLLELWEQINNYVVNIDWLWIQEINSKQLTKPPRGVSLQKCTVALYSDEIICPWSSYFISISFCALWLYSNW